MMPAEDNKDKEARHAILLEDEMKRVGLPPYKEYDFWHRKSDVYETETCFRNNHVGFLMRNYLRIGYPSLNEVVSFLVPLIRHHMLVEQDCWVRSDPRCISFVEDDGAISDVQALVSLIRKDRCAREDLLVEEIRRCGEADFSKCCRDHYMGRAADAFTKNGEGKAEWIAYATTTFSRREELRTVFRNAISSFLWILKKMLHWRSKSGGKRLGKSKKKFRQ